MQVKDVIPSPKNSQLTAKVMNTDVKTLQEQREGTTTQY